MFPQMTQVIPPGAVGCETGRVKCLLRVPLSVGLNCRGGVGSAILRLFDLTDSF